jgi:hypothetical protein
MVEFAVKKKSGSNLKTGYAIPKDASMTFYWEAINYDSFEKNIFLSLDCEYLPNQPIWYMDVGMGALQHDVCAGPFFRKRSLFKPYFCIKPLT